MNLNKFLKIAIVAVISFWSVNSFSQTVVMEKHLKGAVPINENGRIEFNREIEINKSISANQLFLLVEKWASEKYKPTNNKDKNRIVWESSQENKLIANGEDKLIFKSNAISLDQALMEYKLTIQTENGKCLLSFSNIKYNYQDFNKNEKAEDIISDKVAYNSSKNKLNRFYDKFRVFTINQIDLINDDLVKYLSNLSVNDITKEQAKQLNESDRSIVSSDAISIVDNQNKKEASVIEATKLTPAKEVAQKGFNGYKALDSRSIPENYSSMISQSNAVVTTIVDGKPTYFLAELEPSNNITIKPIILISAFSNTDNYDESILNNYIINIVNNVIYQDLLNKFEKGDFSAGQTILNQNSIALSDAWLIIECSNGELVNSFGDSTKIISSKWNTNENKYKIKGTIDKIWVK